MASMRDIKRRKTSIQSTQQITKAMKLVSTVKLQRAKARAEQSKNYTMLMYDTIVSITNSFYQKFPERFILKRNLTQYIKHLAAKSQSFFLNL